MPQGKYRLQSLGEVFSIVNREGNVILRSTFAWSRKLSKKQQEAIVELVADANAGASWRAEQQEFSFKDVTDNMSSTATHPSQPENKDEAF